VEGDGVRDRLVGLVVAALVAVGAAAAVGKRAFRVALNAASRR
jgi:hypothetical protein